MKLKELAAAFTGGTPVEVWDADAEGLYLAFDGTAAELAEDGREAARACIAEGTLAIRLQGAEPTADDVANLQQLGYTFFEV